MESISTRIIEWDPFWGGIQTSRKCMVHIEGFPRKKKKNMVLMKLGVGVKFPGPNFQCEGHSCWRPPVWLECPKRWAFWDLLMYVDASNTLAVALVLRLVVIHSHFWRLFLCSTVPRTNSKFGHESRHFASKGKEIRLPTHHFFKGELDVSFRECI